MFGSVSNDTRADWAQTAIDAFQDATRTDTGDALPDLLADLMHWADANGANFLAMLNRAASNYAAELEQEAAEEDCHETDPAALALQPFHYIRLDGFAPPPAANGES